MSECYDDYEGRLRDVIAAAIARIRGEFDSAELVKFGPLSSDTLADVLAILRTSV